MLLKYVKAWEACWCPFCSQVGNITSCPFLRLCCPRFRLGVQWSIFLSDQHFLFICRYVGSLSSANLQENPRPSTNLEIIAGWHIRAVTTPDIKKLTCLQCLKTCQIPVVSMNLPNGTWTNLWNTSSLSMSSKATHPGWGRQSGSGAMAGTEWELLACWISHPLLGSVQNG